jgi:predicted nucleotidyltransferase
MSPMALDDMLSLLAERIRDAVHPEKIILFGSWARGDARPDSDFDIFVQVEAGRDVGQASRAAYEAVHSIQSLLGRGVDIIVRDRFFVERYAGLVGTILPAVQEDGRVLYARQ